LETTGKTDDDQVTHFHQSSCIHVPHKQVCLQKWGGGVIVKWWCHSEQWWRFLRVTGKIQQNVIEQTPPKIIC
jgi:hypothetical protein